MNPHFRYLHYWTSSLILCTLLAHATDQERAVSKVYQSSDHSTVSQVGSCPKDVCNGVEASTGAVLLQTSKSGLSLSNWQPPQSQSDVDAQIHFRRVLYVAGIMVVVVMVLAYAWYNNFWRTAAWWSRTIESADMGPEVSVAGTESVGTRITRSRSKYMADVDTESDDSAGDWHPLRSMGLARSLGLQSSTDSIDKQKEDVHNFIAETNTSWKVFFRILGALAQVWGMLGLMYWSLLTKDDELMDCLAHPHGRFVSHLCTYTHACLRGFPILAANVTLVLMVRILVQNRIYYSFLSLGYVLDFADTQIMHSHWPWLFVLSMVQGGAHLLLKMYYDPEPIVFESYIALVRKFCIPGAIFISFFLRYVEIENTLMPLNRLAERDYSKEDRHFHSLAELEALNERVLAFDCRHRDVVGDVWDLNDKRPGLADVFKNLIDTYEEAAKKFYRKKVHYEWGFFRSLWPAAVLVDTRLDWHEPDTWSWLCVYGIVAGGSVVVSFCSVCFFVASIWRNLILGEEYQKLGGNPFVVTETGLAILVLLVHALLVIFFLHRTVKGMFYFDLRRKAEVDVSEL